MNTIYVVPCGTSVLDQLSGKLLDAGGSGGKVKRFADAAKDATWLTGVDLNKEDAALSAWQDNMAAKAEATKLHEAVPKRLSAETHSLARRAGLPGINADEGVILLASDTFGGVSAAFCVAHYLAGGDCAAIAYTSTPERGEDAFRLPAGEPAVTVVRIRDLAQGTTDFSKPVAGIGKVLRAAWDTGATIEVHLTGGFKATLLHTLAMSELLHSLDTKRLSAWYVFEDVIDTGSDEPLAPTPISLRAFDRDYVALMQGELGHALHHVKTGGRTFEGVGWFWAADGTRRLTDFGYGYLAVLGKLAASLGDDNQ